MLEKFLIRSEINRPCTGQRGLMGIQYCRKGLIMNQPLPPQGWGIVNPVDIGDPFSSALACFHTWTEINS